MDSDSIDPPGSCPECDATLKRKMWDSRTRIPGSGWVFTKAGIIIIFSIIVSVVMMTSYTDEEARYTDRRGRIKDARSKYLIIPLFAGILVLGHYTRVYLRLPRLRSVTCDCGWTDEFEVGRKRKEKRLEDDKKVRENKGRRSPSRYRRRE